MLVAHGGGAPEALTVILPIMIFAAFLYVERRNRRRDSEAAPPPQEGATPAGDPDGSPPNPA